MSTSTATENQPITVACLGAGGRGAGFGQVIHEVPHLARVVAVAEPRAAYRETFTGEHQLPGDCVFDDWREFVAGPKRCDAVVIATMDREHVAPAIACLEKGYDVFLEKPMATTLEDCQRIEAAQRKSGKILAVCHSLRYQKGFQHVKQLVAEGAIGELVTIDQLEQVAFWHQAHSFVRGNWGNAGRASFMLLAKSCHDLDYIAYLAERPCQRVTSFGGLNYFTRAHAPVGSTERCTDGCAVEASCPYSAIKVYAQGDLTVWPANVCSPVHTPAAHREAIQTGPYGRCVWRCDNDVVDHQVVALEFAGGLTATFTMTAFTQGGGRRLRLHGTKGELLFDEEQIVVRTFADNNRHEIKWGAEPGGHGGGDTRAIRSWLEAIRQRNPSLVLTDAQESLRTHTIVFAAEQSRLERRTVEISAVEKP